MATRAAVPKPEAFQRGKTAFIQGRERRKGSKAFKQAQLVESRRLEKALNRLDHGKHIYAYKHFRTNQVIYSLTRVLDVSSTHQDLLVTISNLISVSIEQKSSLPTRLPWQEDRSSFPSPRHVGTILLCAFPTSLAGSRCLPSIARILPSPRTLPSAVASHHLLRSHRALEEA